MNKEKNIIAKRSLWNRFYSADVVFVFRALIASVLTLIAFISISHKPEDLTLFAICMLIASMLSIQSTILLVVGFLFIIITNLMSVSMAIMLGAIMISSTLLYLFQKKKNR